MLDSIRCGLAPAGHAAVPRLWLRRVLTHESEPRSAVVRTRKSAVRCVSCPRLRLLVALSPKTRGAASRTTLADALPIRHHVSMAGPKRRQPDPVPPALRGLVIDGANVIASSRFRPVERLDLVVQWCHDWRDDLPIQVFIDHTTAMRCQRKDQETLRGRCQDVTPGRPRYAVCPRGESADGHVLEHAREHGALVISNDRFWDFDDLRIGTITLQFRLKGDDFAPHEEATWFRPPDSAVRVPVTTLRELFKTDDSD